MSGLFSSLPTGAVGLYACKWVNNGYTGPILKLRANTDTGGTGMTDFYMDKTGTAIGTATNGTGTTLTAWLLAKSSATIAYVHTWYDQSGLANHAIQTAIGSQPTFIPNKIYFNTSTNLPINPSNAFFTSTGNIPFTVTFKMSCSSGENNFLLYSGNGANSGQQLQLGYNYGTAQAFAGFGGSATFVSANDTDFIMTTRFNNTTYVRNIYLNGSSTISGTTTDAFNFQPSVNTIGVFFTGSCSYLWINNTTVSDTDKNIMENLTTPTGVVGMSATNTTIMDTLIPGKSPWGIYDASLWNSTTNTLPEARGNGRDVLGGGTITQSSSSGNGASASIPYISGGTTSTLTWPTGSIPTQFTLCSIARFIDTIGSRVLQSITLNFAHGSINTNLGVTYYGLFKTATFGNSSLNKTNWFVSCGKNGLSTDNGGTDTTANSILNNSTPVGTAFGGVGNNILCINNNPTYISTYSNWSFTYTVIYDTVLTDVEMLTVSKKLQLYLSTGSFYTPVICGGQSSSSVVLGYYDSKTLQGMNSISIGVNAGQTAQGNNAIAIGNSTAGSTQGNYSIAIGAFAGQTSQPANSIVLNASGNSLNGATASATYISPIRSTPFISGSSDLRYDATGKEVFTTGLPICASILYGFTSDLSLANNTATTAPFTSLLRSYNFSITGLSMSGGVLTNTSGYTLVINISCYINFQNVSGFKEIWINHSVLGRIGDYSIATNDSNAINATINTILLNGENIYIALNQTTGSANTVSLNSHLSITVLSH